MGWGGGGCTKREKGKRMRGRVIFKGIASKVLIERRRLLRREDDKGEKYMCDHDFFKILP